MICLFCRTPTTVHHGHVCLQRRALGRVASSTYTLMLAAIMRRRRARAA